MGISFSNIAADIIGSNQKVLFYPSSGNNQKGLFKMDYDVFIFAEKHCPTILERFFYCRSIVKSVPGAKYPKKIEKDIYCFTVGGKKAYLFFKDNDAVLARIKAEGVGISAFVGVCDGCRQGGNDSCVNGSDWLDKAFSSFRNGQGVYITDHSDLLYNWDRYHEARYREDYTFNNWNLRLIYSRAQKSFDERDYSESEYPFLAKYSPSLAVYKVSLIQAQGKF